MAIFFSTRQKLQHSQVMLFFLLFCLILFCWFFFFFFWYGFLKLPNVSRKFCDVFIFFFSIK